jgi:hypothetical protein
MRTFEIIALAKNRQEVSTFQEIGDEGEVWYVCRNVKLIDKGSVKTALSV